jgi:hypothetical protein
MLYIFNMQKTLKQLINEQKQSQELIPDKAFQLKLEQQVQNKIAQTQKSKLSFWQSVKLLRYKLLGGFAVFVITTLAVLAFVIKTPQGNLGVVYALDKIRATYEQVQGWNKIIYDRTNMEIVDCDCESDNAEYAKLINNSVITYEKWTDTDSFMSRSTVKYAYINSFSYFVHDNNDVSWNYYSDENSLTKTIYKNRASANANNGIMQIQSIQTVKEFLNKEQSDLYKEDDQYFVFKNDVQYSYERANGEKPVGYDLYYYSKQTFLLEKQERFFKRDGQYIMGTRITFELTSLPRTDENIKKYFVFDLKLPSGVNEKIETVDLGGNSVSISPTISVEPSNSALTTDNSEQIYQVVPSLGATDNVEIN